MNEETTISRDVADGRITEGSLFLQIVQANKAETSFFHPLLFSPFVALRFRYACMKGI
jgi:hypothetical protein